ncbi:MAG: hypothetical protein V1691_01065 [Chloroflexota bacterium]
MSEALGKIEKPAAESFVKGRRLYFVPLIYCGEEAPDEYMEKFDRYWEQVEGQVSDLESKLGKIDRVFHELVMEGGEKGSEALKDLNSRSYQVVKARMDRGAQLEPVEEGGLLTEFMDWSRCLAVGLQNDRVFTQVYQAYVEVGKKRYEHASRQIAEALKSDETGLLLAREGHQIKFPPDIQLFYVSPPAFDEIKRWLREHKEL